MSFETFVVNFNDFCNQVFVVFFFFLYSSRGYSLPWNWKLKIEIFLHSKQIYKSSNAGLVFNFNYLVSDKSTHTDASLQLSLNINLLKAAIISKFMQSFRYPIGSFFSAIWWQQW